MTFLLQSAAGTPDAETLDRPVPTRGERAAAALRSERLTRNQWDQVHLVEQKLLDEIQAQTGDVDYRRLSPIEAARRGRKQWSIKRDALLAHIATTRETTADAFSGLPANQEAFDAEVTRRLRADLDEQTAIVANAPQGSWGPELAGSLAAGATDQTTLLTLPLGAPARASAAGVMALEGALGAGAELADIRSRVAPTAERLDLPEPSAASEALTAGLLSAGLAGGIVGAARLVQYRKTQREASMAQAPERTSAIDASEQVDRAETELRDDVPVSSPSDAASYIEAGLIARGLPEHIARAFVWNFRDESGLRPGINEAAPIVPGSRGGFGLAQWTGPRRRELEAYASSVGKPIDDIDMQLDFLMRELEGAEAVAANRIFAAADTPTAAAAIVQHFLRPLPQHQASRSARYLRGNPGQDAVVPVDAPQPTTTSRPFTRNDQLRAGDDITIDVQYEVVDVSALNRAAGELQPRDRTRISSDVWIAETAARLDPAQLMPAATADRGAPVVGPDNVIESGNGRVAAIEQAYRQFPDRADAYRDRIAALGLEIPDGVERPVLVARRTSQLSRDQRRDFVIAAQDSGVARMTPTEIAQTSARAMTPDRLALFDPAQSLADASNAPFVRSVLGALPRSERNALFDNQGLLNAEGRRRLQNAFFARAWNAPDLIADFAERETAGEFRSLMDALERSAPDWAALRADIEAGQVKEQFDISGFVTDAMRLIARARREAAQGQGVYDVLQEFLGEIDLLEGPVPPLTVRLVQRMYDGGRVQSAQKLSDFLSAYAREARSAGKTADMFGSSPAAVLQRLDKRFANLSEDLGRPRGAALPPTIQALPDNAFDEGATATEAITDIASPEFAALREDLADFADVEFEQADGTAVRVADLIDDLEQDDALAKAVNTCFLGENAA
ncbi:MAG: phage tail tip lysozyme [Pseudomonadota bacterium]